LQLGLPSVTNKCSTMNPGNSFIFGSKVMSHKTDAGVDLWALLSAGFF